MLPLEVLATAEAEKAKHREPMEFTALLPELEASRIDHNHLQEICAVDRSQSVA